MLVLASGSQVRADMLRAAGVKVEIRPARIDEDAVKESLLVEGARARDVADTLAEMKALKPQVGGLVLGADQVLSHGGKLLSKPATPHEAREQLAMLAGRQHRLISAAVIVEDGRPVWRHASEVRMVMRPLSDGFLDSYVSEYWEGIRHCVGGYRLEAEGARLFTAVEGDYFSVLGLPLLPVIDYLVTRGVLDA
ncbi:Maf family protein [Jannaschia aquimarina]|uniref:Nucleoside triphosphate pyrophosphatase n=1 Tax=Jannaschia aquimarina TaxID=935700 RepID=A0A0D1EGJ0_9RHOB|nr:nucleoside triphosphate pyrophosphatase [Jannaschia aquimarina]KIT14965.1 Septum formation protein Maf [Jannaschia aquimarina]SNS60639.1 septum formation protein [Jannaschia aquimarina]